MMADAELESALSQKWRAFIAAVATDKCDDARRLWHELERLHAQRTPEQRARALMLAGLNADGTPIAG